MLILTVTRQQLGWMPFIDGISKIGTVLTWQFDLDDSAGETEWMIALLFIELPLDSPAHKFAVLAGPYALAEICGICDSLITIGKGSLALYLLLFCLKQILSIIPRQLRAISRGTGS
jgi:hypothetical protein